MAFEKISPIAPAASSNSSSNWFEMDKSPTTERTVLPDGLYHAIFCGASNNGYQETNYGRKTEISLYFAVYSELSEEAEIVTLYKNTTAGFNEKSATYKMAKAICGNGELIGDLSKLIGKPVQVMVTSYTNTLGNAANKLENTFASAQYNIPIKKASVPKYMAAKAIDYIGREYLEIPTLSSEEIAKYADNKKEVKASAPVLQRRSFNDKPIADNPKRVSNTVDNITAHQITEFLNAPSVKADLE